MKNKLKLLILAIPFAILTMVSAGFANAAGTETSSGTVEPYPYISPTPGEFPIIAWGVECNTSRQVFKDVMDCGFNAVMIQDINVNTHKIVEALNPVTGEDTIKLNLIGHMGWFATDTVYRHTPGDMPGCMDYVENLFNTNRSASNQSTITGWYILDEPKFCDLDKYADYFNAMAQHDASRMIWLNLLGDPRSSSLAPNSNKSIKQNTTTDNVLDTIADLTSLRGYVEHFCNTSKAGVLSYDYYPIAVDINNNVNPTLTQHRLNDFYACLQLYSEISKKRNRPFWAFCQSRATNLDNNYNRIGSGHPAPTEEYLRYEAFNALAFGAQGIEYWNYVEPYNASGKTDPNSYFALSTSDGKKTPLWYYAQKVNSEIKNLSYIFLGAKLESYYFVGDPQNTDFEDYKKGDSAKVMSVSAGTAFNYRGSNRGALVSTLVNGNNHYIVIVNQSPFESIYLNLFLNITDYNITDIDDICEFIPNDPPIANTNGFIKPERPSIGLGKRLILKPGGYKIYVYSPKKKTNNNQVL